jgi:hypothetical protein
MPTLTEVRPPQPQQVETPPRADTRAWLQDRVSNAWGFGLLAAWYVLVVLSQIMQPAVHDEGAVLAWIGVVLSVVFTAAVLVAMAGLALRRRWGLVASLGAAGLLVADSIACPMTGHHQFGAWVVVQSVGSVALAGASIRALRRT